MAIKEEAILEGRLGSPGFLASIHPTVLGLYRLAGPPGRIAGGGRDVRRDGRHRRAVAAPVRA